MDLIRLDSNPNPKPEEPDDHRKNEYGIAKVQDEILPEDSVARVVFPRVGRGEQKRSDFAVEVSWIDVQGLVRSFIEMKHPDALYLERAMRLVRKIEDCSWNSDDPASEDFWEILPSS